MRRRLPAAGVLLVSGAALAGCDLIDHFIDTITGGPGSGTGGFGAVVSGRMEFRLAAYITKSEGSLESGTVGTAFWSGGGSYDAATRTFTTTSDGGDFSDTYSEVRLNDTEEYVESFYAARRSPACGEYGLTCMRSAATTSCTRARKGRLASSRSTAPTPTSSSICSRTRRGRRRSGVLKIRSSG